MKQMKKLMQRNGFELTRETKHFIWKHKTGVVMTTSKPHPIIMRLLRHRVKSVEQLEK